MVLVGAAGVALGGVAATAVRDCMTDRSTAALVVVWKMRFLIRCQVTSHCSRRRVVAHARGTIGRFSSYNTGETVVACVHPRVALKGWLVALLYLVADLSRRPFAPTFRIAFAFIVQIYIDGVLGCGLSFSIGYRAVAVASCASECGTLRLLSS
jgi:hypothetical protein